MLKIKNFLIVFYIIINFLTSFVYAEEISVATIERPPMAFKTASGEWTGFSIDLMKEVLKENKINFSIKEYQSFEEMINSVQEKENNLAVANITITSERERKMDFSQPIFDSGLQIVIPENNKSSLLDIIMKSGILWFLLGALAILLLIAHIVWFFERGNETDRHDYFRDDYFGGVWDAFWWAFIIMTMGGFENEVPASKFSRFLAIIWIITSLFFVSFLTAQITSSMTVAELNSSITSYDDLKNKKVGVMKSDVVIKFIDNEVGAKSVVFEKYDDFYEALESGKVDALIGDAPIVNYYISNNKKARKIKTVGEVFKPEKYGVIFPDNSPMLKEKFDITLIKFQENGKYKEIYDKYFDK